MSFMNLMTRTILVAFASSFAVVNATEYDPTGTYRGGFYCEFFEAGVARVEWTPETLAVSLDSSGGVVSVHSPKFASHYTGFRSFDPLNNDPGRIGLALCHTSVVPVVVSETAELRPGVDGSLRGRSTFMGNFPSSPDGTGVTGSCLWLFVRVDAADPGNENCPSP